MKYMIASDIHGSAKYCREMLEAYKKEQPDKLILLGDILYHGPRNDLPAEYAPKEVIAMLNPLAGELLCVRGNCEAEVDQMVLDFPVLADYAVFYVGGKMIFATHGHLYGEKNPPKLHGDDVLLCGHTHVPAHTQYENYRYINPGSVSIPKENSPHAYMVITEEEILYKTLAGETYRREKL